MQFLLYNEKRRAFKMKQANKWTVKDVITTVLLTVLLIVIQMVVNMVCMVNDFVSMVLSVGFTMLLCAPVYFLMVSRIHKRFVSLIYMTILGCVFPNHGQLVSAALLHRRRPHLRGDPLEKTAGSRRGK